MDGEKRLYDLNNRLINYKHIVLVSGLALILLAAPLTNLAYAQDKWTFDTLVTHLADKYDQDENLARRIIKCESRNNPNAIGNNYHWIDSGEYEDGDPIWIRRVWSRDWGYWQLNDYYNHKTALRRGFDVKNDWQDNLEYGFIMLTENGNGPWKASRNCWKT